VDEYIFKYTHPHIHGGLKMYNQDDDKLIKEFVKEGISVKIGIYSYKGSAPKLQLTRTSEPQHFVKLGRMTIDEAKFLRDNINEIIESLEPEDK
jgi:hypothetical protein